MSTDHQEAVESMEQEVEKVESEITLLSAHTNPVANPRALFALGQAHKYLIAAKRELCIAKELIE